MRNIQTSLVCATILILVTMTLYATPVFAAINQVSVHISDVHVYSDDSGLKDNLRFNVKVNIGCGQETNLGPLTLSVTLSGPDGPVNLGTAAFKSASAVCGPNTFAFDFSDILKQSGWYTISAAANVNGLTVSNTHSFDPSTDGGHGPPD
jgi:hypothetical protein